tara:strand:+ start:620 stop:766 length:147 start_codon:yes stop_codon:yes gene_type:complete
MHQVTYEKIDKKMDENFIIYEKCVLVNAFFYTFWISREEFNKFILNNN